MHEEKLHLNRQDTIPLSYPLSLEGREELSAPLSARRRGVGGEVDTKRFNRLEMVFLACFR
jgi:hypothetical protein